MRHANNNPKRFAQFHEQSQSAPNPRRPKPNAMRARRKTAETHCTVKSSRPDSTKLLAIVARPFDFLLSFFGRQPPATYPNKRPQARYERYPGRAAGAATSLALLAGGRSGGANEYHRDYTDHANERALDKYTACTA